MPLYSMSERSKTARTHFFQTTILNEKIKDCISGDNEKVVVSVLDTIGFKLGIDYVRQHPFAEMFVFDFAFINEQVFLEIDGNTHRTKKQRQKDKIRDRYCKENNWVCIRIDDRNFRDLYKLSFYKSLIKQVVLDRRDDYEKGNVRRADFINFNEIDYV